MQELNRILQEHITANAEKIRELGFQTSALKFQNGDVQNLKFSVMDKLHKPLVAACKVVAAGNRIVMQPENQGGSFIEDGRSKHRKRILNEMEFSCSRVGLSDRIHRSDWRPLSSRAQTTTG